METDRLQPHATYAKNLVDGHESEETVALIWLRWATFDNTWAAAPGKYVGHTCRCKYWEQSLGWKNTFELQCYNTITRACRDGIDSRLSGATQFLSKTVDGLKGVRHKGAGCAQVETKIGRSSQEPVPEVSRTGLRWRKRHIHLRCSTTTCTQGAARVMVWKFQFICTYLMGAPAISSHTRLHLPVRGLSDTPRHGTTLPLSRAAGRYPSEVIWQDPIPAVTYKLLFFFFFFNCKWIATMRVRFSSGYQWVTN